MIRVAEYRTGYYNVALDFIGLKSSAKLPLFSQNI